MSRNNDWNRTCVDSVISNSLHVQSKMIKNEGNVTGGGGGRGEGGKARCSASFITFLLSSIDQHKPLIYSLLLQSLLGNY